MQILDRSSYQKSEIQGVEIVVASLLDEEKEGYKSAGKKRCEMGGGTYEYVGRAVEFAPNADKEEVLLVQQSNNSKVITRVSPTPRAPRRRARDERRMVGRQIE